MIQQSIDRMSMLIQKHRRTCIAVMFLCLYSVSISFAAPLYTSSNTTLDPQCAPTDTNCTVQQVTGTVDATAIQDGTVPSSKLIGTDITTVGTITSGVWQGTSLADAYIASAPTWNAKQDALGYTPYNATNPAGYVSDISSFTTTNLSEGTNLYFTNARALTALSGQPLSSFTNDAGYITSSSANTLTNKSGNISQWTNNVGYITNLSSFTTSNLTEGSNLYFTNARARSAALTLDANNSFIVGGGAAGSGNAYSTYIGLNAGNGATSASSSNFFGQQAGNGATNAGNSNFFGTQAGDSAVSASYSNFFGFRSGMEANNASSSNFFGSNAGYQATSASSSNFFGTSAGSSATNAYSSNFFGVEAGVNAANAYYSNFFGEGAGGDSEGAYSSNFFGYYTGQNATGAYYSNFFGEGAGQNASNAYNSNFFGPYSGANATNAYYANFFGAGAGQNATNASNSIFIGRESGLDDGVDNTTDGSNFSILIGPSTNTGGFSNSIAVGGFAQNTAANQFMIGSGTRPITQFAINGTDAYLNFLGETQSTGSLGYGFRDNGGIIEYKNNTGAWAEMGRPADGVVRGTNLIISADQIVLGTPQDVTANQICDDGCNYPAEEYTHTYRIYAYRDTVQGRTYSDSYGTVTFVDDISGNNYDVTVSWDAVTGADGYRVLKYDNYNGYNYDAGFDTTSTSFIDDGCGNVCFDAGLSSVFSTSSVVNVSSSDKLFTVSGTLSLNGSTIRADDSGNYGMGVNLGAVGSLSNTVFIGYSAGNGATSVSDSNFFGREAGLFAVGSRRSNFFGNRAGYSASSAFASNFFGDNAGYGATNASYSNFFGNQAGYNSNASNSNFFGPSAGGSGPGGVAATNASNSNFFGGSAGNGATNAYYSNFFGASAGDGATNASNSIFIGKTSGYNDTVNNRGSNNDFSILIGPNTNTGGFSNSIALGGYAVNTASNQVMFGSSTRPVSQVVINGSNSYINFGSTGGVGGYGVRDNAGIIEFKNSNGSWSNLGTISLNANQSIIAGGGFSAPISNFLGVNAGQNATNVSGSNFFGLTAGDGATNASYSNFFGQQAGSGASNASYSTLIGVAVGKTFTGNNIGSNNIIIGTNISLPNAAANSINIGGVLFGTGTYATVGGNTLITPVSGGKIGIGVVSPTYTLSVGNSSIAGIIAGFTNSTGTCTINPTTTSLSCSSDMNLKKDITVLRTNTTWNYTQHTTTQDTPLLDKVLSLQPVRYHWNTESSQDTLHTGFIAQDIEQLFPELVTTDTSTGYKTLNQLGLLPYTIAAVQELAVKVQAIPTFSNTSLYTTIATFLDGIAQRGEAVIATVTSRLVTTDKVQTKELCVDDVCVTKDQLKALLQQGITIIIPAQSSSSVPSPAPTETATTTTEASPVSSGITQTELEAPASEVVTTHTETQTTVEQTAPVEAVTPVTQP